MQANSKINISFFGLLPFLCCSLCGLIFLQTTVKKATNKAKSENIPMNIRRALHIHDPDIYEESISSDELFPPLHETPDLEPVSNLPDQDEFLYLCR